MLMYNVNNVAIFVHLEFWAVSEMVDGEAALMESHQYYHQIQGQLHITGKACCDLVVWTKKDMQVVRVAREEAWAENIDKLLNFYFEDYIFWSV
jgi:hypothetical protein